MKPAPFEYYAPKTLAEALSIMKEHGDDAKPLAGGQSLIPVMNFRLAQPALLVDLNTVSELRSLTANGSLRLGAMVRQATLEKHRLVAQYQPLIHQTMPYVAHPQIRNRGTVGGSLSHADPAGELPVLMVTLDASFKLQTVDSERWVKAVDFYQSLFETALKPDELLTEIKIPALPVGTHTAFQELSRRHGDYAMVGVAVRLQLDEEGVCQAAKLVYLNLGDVPMVAHEAAKLLIGERVTDDLITAVSHHAAQHEINPASTIHASAPYKRHLATVLTQRTIKQALQI